MFVGVGCVDSIFCMKFGWYYDVDYINIWVICDFVYGIVGIDILIWNVVLLLLGGNFFWVVCYDIGEVVVFCYLEGWCELFVGVVV